MMSMTEYASNDDMKRPWRRDVSCKVPSYCPYPVCTKQPVDIMDQVFITKTPPLSSKPFIVEVDEAPSRTQHNDDQVVSLPFPVSLPYTVSLPVPISPRCITLNELKFEKLIGTGMYSKVYLVQSNKSKDYFALKVMPKTLMKKTKSETEVMSSVDHPFIVKLWNSFEDE